MGVHILPKNSLKQYVRLYINVVKEEDYLASIFEKRKQTSKLSVALNWTEPSFYVSTKLDSFSSGSRGGGQGGHGPPLACKK